MVLPGELPERIFSLIFIAFDARHMSFDGDFMPTLGTEALHRKAGPRYMGPASGSTHTVKTTFSGLLTSK